MLWILKSVGEPWLWSIHPEQLDVFLRKSGWRYTPELVEVDGKQGVELFAVGIK